MCIHRIRVAIAMLALLSAVPCRLGLAAETDAAPRLMQCRADGHADLGLWDDVWHGDELNFLVLRRGAELFSPTPALADGIKRLGAFPKLKNSRIVAGGNGTSVSGCCVNRPTGLRSPST